MTAGDPSLSVPRTIALIGGEGRMGTLFRALFEADGHRVLSAGPMADPAYGGVVAEADAVIVTVPIAETVAVIARIAPYLRPDQLLSDFTSIKSEPVAAMLATPARVIGAHPIFAPLPDPAGQNVVLCPARPGAFLPWYRDFFRRHGMTVVEMEPEAHDEAMAFIQGLTHFINIVFAQTLQTRGADLSRILQVCSPVYQVLFAILCRILSGDPVLYGQIQIANRKNLPVLEDFLANGHALLEAVEERSPEGVYRIFDEAAAFLGDFRQVAREESDFLIARMTEYLRDRKGEKGGQN
jgi:prephenate dehydrogenase